MNLSSLQFASESHYTNKHISRACSTSSFYFSPSIKIFLQSCLGLNEAVSDELKRPWLKRSCCTGRDSDSPRSLAVDGWFALAVAGDVRGKGSLQLPLVGCGVFEKQFLLLLYLQQLRRHYSQLSQLDFDIASTLCWTSKEAARWLFSLPSRTLSVTRFSEFCHQIPYKFHQIWRKKIH